MLGQAQAGAQRAFGPGLRGGMLVSEARLPSSDRIRLHFAASQAPATRYVGVVMPRCHFLECKLHRAFVVMVVTSIMTCFDIHGWRLVLTSMGGDMLLQ